MDKDINIDQIYKFKNAIGYLQGITYKDIFINDIGIRILGIHYMDNGPSWNITKHKHSFFEFHYILKDNVFTTINDNEYDICQGQYYCYETVFSAVA